MHIIDGEKFIYIEIYDHKGRNIRTTDYNSEFDQGWDIHYYYDKLDSPYEWRVFDGHMKLLNRFEADYDEDETETQLRQYDHNDVLEYRFVKNYIRGRLISEITYSPEGDIIKIELWEH